MAWTFHFIFFKVFFHVFWIWRITKISLLIWLFIIPRLFYAIKSCHTRIFKAQFFFSARFPSSWTLFTFMLTDLFLNLVLVRANTASNVSDRSALSLLYSICTRPFRWRSWHHPWPPTRHQSDSSAVQYPPSVLFQSLASPEPRTASTARPWRRRYCQRYRSSKLTPRPIHLEALESRSWWFEPVPKPADSQQIPRTDPLWRSKLDRRTRTRLRLCLQSSFKLKFVFLAMRAKSQTWQSGPLGGDWLADWVRVQRIVVEVSSKDERVVVVIAEGGIDFGQRTQLGHNGEGVSVANAVELANVLARDFFEFQIIPQRRSAAAW